MARVLTGVECVAYFARATPVLGARDRESWYSNSSISPAWAVNLKRTLLLRRSTVDFLRLVKKNGEKNQRTETREREFRYSVI